MISDAYCVSILFYFICHCNAHLVCRSDSDECVVLFIHVISFAELRAIDPVIQCHRTVIRIVRCFILHFINCSHGVFQSRRTRNPPQTYQSAEFESSC